MVDFPKPICVQIKRGDAHPYGRSARRPLHGNLDAWFCGDFTQLSRTPNLFRIPELPDRAFGFKPGQLVWAENLIRLKLNDRGQRVPKSNASRDVIGLRCS